MALVLRSLDEVFGFLKKELDLLAEELTENSFEFVKKRNRTIKTVAIAMTKLQESAKLNNDFVLDNKITGIISKLESLSAELGGESFDVDAVLVKCNDLRINSLT